MSKRIDLDAPCVMSETDFRQLFLTTFGASQGFTVWAPNPGGAVVRDRRGSVRGYFRSGIATGTLDLMGFTHGDGLHFEFELKNEDTVTSPEQHVRMGRLRAMGCVVAFYRIKRDLSIGENLRQAHGALVVAIADRRSRTGHAATEYDLPCIGDKQ